MTMTTPKRSTEASLARSSIQWTIVQAGLWVGKANGEFAGMIEAHGDAGFSATTHRAKYLGSFPTVEAAKASFER
ncbi:MAG: hypothetical protein KF761_12565 [Salinibacterium sp.]|nr:hypothetical protein [Salinibacterium sp.]